MTMSSTGVSSRCVRRAFALCVAASLTCGPATAQTLTGPFERFNPWWLHPSFGTPGVNGGAQICIDLDGDGVTESCYALPSVPSGALTNLRLSPTRRVLLAFGATSDCGGDTQVHFFDVPDPPGDLTFIDSECIPNGVNSGQIGFYDTGLCCDGLTDPSCPSLGLSCFDSIGDPLLGVSPQRVAYVADTGDAFTQTVQIYWFDLNNGTHTKTFPGFDESLQLTRVPVSPYGDVAFVQHDVGGDSDSNYTAIDLCAGSRFGLPLSSAVGGALFGLGTPTATAEMVDAGGGDFLVVVTHPDLTGGQLALEFTPCSEGPPPAIGACCRLDGCSEETTDDCEALGGDWLGPETDCQDCPAFTLTVNVNGGGSVSSDPTGISCPSDCDETYAAGQAVTLTATPSGGAVFIGWSGDCSGTDPMIDVTLDADRKCTAGFDFVADLGISKSDNPDPVLAGDPLTYTLNVSNAGPSDATTVFVADTLPSGVTYDQDSSDPACQESGTVISCDIGDLPNGENRSVVIGVNVDPDTRGTLVNSASVSGDQTDLNPSNNSQNHATTVEAEADLSVTKAASPEPVAAGGRLLYEITVSNNGPSLATGVDVSDTLPADVTPAGDGSGSGNVVCGVGSGEVAPGETLTLGFSVLVDPGLADGAILTNTVEVIGNETDPVPSNNIATVDSMVSGQIPAPAGPTFVKIADTDMPIPSGTGNFTNFGVLSAAAVSDGNVAIRGRGVDQDGIYLWQNGALDVVADVNTPIPGGTGTFGAPATGGFGPPSIDGDDVAFGGDDQTISQRGVYALLDGVLEVVADKDTRPPGASDEFSTLGGPSLHDGSISFWAFVPALPFLEGIYFGNPSGITKVADQTTFIPGGGGRFNSFNSGSSQHHSGKVLFFGRDSGFNSGLYMWFKGVLSVIADRFTPIPGGAGNFSFFLEQVSTDGLNIAFRGNDTTQTRPGIYMNDCAGNRVVANTNTPVPCASGTFEWFGAFSTQGGSTAFVGFGAESSGLYVDSGGSIVKVIEVLDSLDGKRVSSLRVAPEGLDGDQLGFRAYFTDGSEGIYLATLTTSGVCYPNDADEDGDRDLHDFGVYQACVGTGAPVSPDCEIFDNDGDGDVDTDDYDGFLAGVTGSIPPLPVEACCLQSGACVMADALECEFIQNGTPAPGETCADNPCAPELGACCSFKGCFVTDAKTCASLEGSHFPGQDCKTAPCE